jgi:hypothetical protein
MNDGPAIPDLLRRFTPTPHVDVVYAGGLRVEAETNDLAIISEMQKAPIPWADGGAHEPLFLKVIRDHEAACNGRELAVVSGYPLSVVCMGTGTFFALDHERREVLGFVAPDVTAADFAESVFPLICKLLIGGPP